MRATVLAMLFVTMVPLAAPAAAAEGLQTYWTRVVTDPAAPERAPNLVTASGIAPDGRHVTLNVSAWNSESRAEVNALYVRGDEALHVAQTYERRGGEILIDATYRLRGDRVRVVATMGVDGSGARVTYVLPGAEPMVVAVQDGNVENRSVTEELHARTAPPSDLFRMIDTYLADLATLPGSVTGPADRLVEAAHPVRDRCADICAAECYHYNCYDCIPYVWDLWCQICTSTCSLGCAIGCA